MERGPSTDEWDGTLETAPISHQDALDGLSALMAGRSHPLAELIQTAIVEGWVPGLHMLRVASRQLIIQQANPTNAGKSFANFLSGVRKATAALPLFLQEPAAHMLDRADLWAADPENESAVCEWVKSWALPWTDPP